MIYYFLHNIYNNGIILLFLILTYIFNKNILHTDILNVIKRYKIYIIM